MKKITLGSYEMENLEDLIPEIEKMYGFEFENDEITKVKSYNELCDLTISKIDKKDIESCTSQQAFYKIRNSIVETKVSEKENLKLDLELKSLFPRKNRIKQIKKVENNIGFKLNDLKAPDFIEMGFIILLLVSFVLLFINWIFGLAGLLVSFLGFKLCRIFGKELNVKTVKELVEKITGENYLSVRSLKNTINKKELKEVITSWIAENAGIEREKLVNAVF